MHPVFQHNLPKLQHTLFKLREDYGFRISAAGQEVPYLIDHLPASSMDSFAHRSVSWAFEGSKL